MPLGTQRVLLLGLTVLVLVGLATKSTSLLHTQVGSLHLPRGWVKQWPFGLPSRPDTSPAQRVRC
jgi:hypothetical protein